MPEIEANGAIEQPASHVGPAEFAAPPRPELMQPSRARPTKRFSGQLLTALAITGKVFLFLVALVVFLAVVAFIADDAQPESSARQSASMRY